MTDRIAIVGGGFSGTLLAINLLRFDGPGVVLVERRGAQIARGVAYSATHSSQLLNVRAGGMSAFPDEPLHFVRWLEGHGGGGATRFVPRATYGAYLAGTLAAVTAIDVALELDAAGFAGRVLALSRRGLRPRRHRDGLPPVDGETDLPGVSLSYWSGNSARRPRRSAGARRSMRRAR